MFFCLHAIHNLNAICTGILKAVKVDFVFLVTDDTVNSSIKVSPPGAWKGKKIYRFLLWEIEMKRWVHFLPLLRIRNYILFMLAHKWYDYEPQPGGEAGGVGGIIFTRAQLSFFTEKHSQGEFIWWINKYLISFGNIEMQLQINW